MSYLVLIPSSRKPPINTPMSPEVFKRINITFDTKACRESKHEQKAYFIKMLISSPSCDLESMQKVIIAAPSLSFEQIEALLDVWHKEKEVGSID